MIYIRALNPDSPCLLPVKYTDELVVRNNNWLQHPMMAPPGMPMPHMMPPFGQPPLPPPPIAQPMLIPHQPPLPPDPTTPPQATYTEQEEPEVEMEPEMQYDDPPAPGTEEPPEKAPRLEGK